MTAPSLGQLVCVLGPSGAGKDALMRGVAAAMPQVHLARRLITRPAHKDSEDYDSVTDTDFAALQQAGHFCFIGRRMASPTACRPVYCPVSS